MNILNSPVIKEIKRIALQILPNGSEIYLYGSRARGDAQQESDWDLLILSKEKIDSQEKYAKYISPFAEIGWYMDYDIIPISYTAQEWDERKNTLFYRNVMKDAIKL